MNAWKRMSTGRYIDLKDFKEEDVDLHDIEVSLNNTLRFNGHAKDRQPLTVAQHSLLCLELARFMFEDEDQLYRKVFIHDFAEAYIGDVSTPVKKVLGRAFYDWADPIEHKVNNVFLSFPITDEDEKQVKLCDMMALDIERRSMWRSQYGKDMWPDCPVDYGTVEKKQELFDRIQRLNYIHFKEVLNVV